MPNELQANAGDLLLNSIKGNSVAPVLQVGEVTHDDSAAYTLTASEYSNFGLVVTGALTAARQLVVPNTDDYVFFVVNNTTDGGGGPYAITVKTSGGTGVSLTNGKSRWFRVKSDEVYPIGAESP